jgi:hypothetical protein
MTSNLGATELRLAMQQWQPQAQAQVQAGERERSAATATDTASASDAVAASSSTATDGAVAGGGSGPLGEKEVEAIVAPVVQARIRTELLGRVDGTAYFREWVGVSRDAHFTSVTHSIHTYE